MAIAGENELSVILDGECGADAGKSENAGCSERGIEISGTSAKTKRNGGGGLATLDSPEHMESRGAQVRGARQRIDRERSARACRNLDRERGHAFRRILELDQGDARLLRRIEERDVDRHLG